MLHTVSSHSGLGYWSIFHPAWSRGLPLAFMPGSRRTATPLPKSVLTSSRAHPPAFRPYHPPPDMRRSLPYHSPIALSPSLLRSSVTLPSLRSSVLVLVSPAELSRNGRRHGKQP